MRSMENKIEKTLESASRIESTTPSDILMQRLRQIPSEVRQGYEAIPVKYIWMAVASIALLIALNIVSAQSYASSQQENSEAAQETNYFSHLKTI